MAIEMAQSVNSLSSQEQVIKEKMQVQNEEIKKQRGDSEFISDEDLRGLVNALENGIKQFNRRLKFDVNKEINRIVVKIIDKDTDKVIREIPSSEIQNLLEKVREAIGLLFDIEI
jgi:flagellar protein FlaG